MVLSHGLPLVRKDKPVVLFNRRAASLRFCGGTLPHVPDILAPLTCWTSLLPLIRTPPSGNGCGCESFPIIAPRAKIRS